MIDWGDKTDRDASYEVTVIMKLKLRTELRVIAID